MQAQATRTTPVTEGSHDVLTSPVTSVKELKEKIKILSNNVTKLIDIALLLGKNDRDYIIPKEGLGDGAQSLTDDPVLKNKDLRSLVQQHKACLLSVVKDVNALKKRQIKNKNGGHTGKGFSNPKFYNTDLVNFFAAARDQIGQVDIDDVNRTIQKITDDEWVREGGKPGEGPKIKPIRLLRNDSDYVVDQLSFITGFYMPKIHENPIKGMASASILTPLMCIYASMMGMQSLATPPEETLEKLQVKYLVKLAKASKKYKNEKTEAKKNKLPDPIVDETNFSRYLTTDVIEKVRSDRSTDAKYRNSAYLGATDLMKQYLGQRTLSQLTIRDQEKLRINQELYEKGEINEKKLRDVKLNPVSTPDYFPFSSLQVITAINTVQKDEYNEVNPAVNKFLVPSTPQQEQAKEQLKETLEKETQFLSAILEYNNCKNGKNNNKKAKKRIKSFLETKLESS